MKNEEKDEKFNFLSDEEETIKEEKKEEHTKKEKFTDNVDKEKEETKEAKNDEEKEDNHDEKNSDLKKDNSKEDKDNDTSDEKKADKSENKAKSKAEEITDMLDDYSEKKTEEENLDVPSDTPKTSGGLYIGYEIRVAIMILFSILLLGAACGLIVDAITYNESKIVSYNESSSTDYKVCLEENSDYTESCLGQDMQYLSLITKNIPVTFNYNVKLSSPIDYKLDYYVVGSLKIVDRDNSERVLYTSEDVLVPNTNVSNQNDMIQFSSNVDVDFKYYNQYVTSYKSRYSLNSDAYLDVILYLNETTGPRRISSVTIPLGAQTYGISKSQTLNNNKNLVIDEKGWAPRNYIGAILGAICAIIGLIILVKLIRMILKVSGSKSKYKRKLEQILREYDRVIVLARNGYEINENKRLIKVLSFNELLDARDTLEKPIVYVKVNEVKSEFYVEDVDKVYKYVMKDADF